MLALPTRPSTPKLTAVAKALRDSGYTGPVGMEAYAAGDSVAALEAFRTAFTVC